MIIIGLLLVIVAILLFGAGAVGNALAMIGTAVLLLLGLALLAYGIDWNGAPVWPAVLGVVVIGVWAFWKTSRQSDQ